MLRATLSLAELVSYLSSVVVLGRVIDVGAVLARNARRSQGLLHFEGQRSSTILHLFPNVHFLIDLDYTTKVLP